MAEGNGPDRLWTPWRMEYILDDNKPGGCIFCEKPGEVNDRENLILYRGEKVFVIMNRYPYTNGHLMIAPYSHKSSLESLSDEELIAISMEMKRVVSLLKEEMNPDGFNIGINMGKAAGAGIEDHLHMHVVPRWGGDTNFMPVLADVRVMPEHLDDTYKKLKPYFNK